MFLKCVGGCMDGAVYVLASDPADPSRQSTTRKPDGLRFNSTDAAGRRVWQEYELEPVGTQVMADCLLYRYVGETVDTEIEFTTE